MKILRSQNFKTETCCPNPLFFNDFFQEFFEFSKNKTNLLVCSISLWNWFELILGSEIEILQPNRH